ncbi:MAG: SUMF1/EgtB/PvdO family nonheme iron enzyme [Acidobacteria bacterium]|jgi:formylglycine-generating enzyme required for sulfatase activity/predicted MPP superfamily phosphohydrolase|nr:SUMF1/EgtB/PvdO family nonheme iron enzyme [Acidobacteriota bacterium]
MSEITILHLSDIHFKRKKDKDHITFRQTVQQRLLEAVSAHLAKHGDPDFLVITGDIAFSGKKEEYNEAFTFLTGLKGILPKAEFLAVPGNHDVDRDKIDEFLSLQKHIVLENLTDKFLENEKKVKHYINVKVKAYRDFIHRLNPGLYQSKEDYFWVKNYKEKNVAFLGLNSAWACEGDQDRFNIALGSAQLTNALGQAGEGTNKILLMHHPPFGGWLKDMETGWSELFKNSRLLLHGHTHSDQALVIKDPAHACIYLGANASYTGDKEGFIGFQFIKVDFPGHEATAATVWPYIFDIRRKEFVPDGERYKGQDGSPYFEIDTVTPVSPAKGKSVAPISLVIPSDYINWIKEFHSVLPVEQLAKKAEAVLINLPDVYIALEVANPFYKPMDEKMLKGKGQENEEDASKVPPTMDIEELLGQWNCLLLRGNAGTGKTTVIRHLAYSLSRGAGPGPLRGCLPVIVLLKDLWPVYKNALREKAENITFEALLPGYLKKVRCPLTMETIEAYLVQGRAFFLLDGLDEIPEENRDHMVDLLHTFQHAYRADRFLVTGRPHGVEGQANHCFGKFLRDIEPLGEKKAGEFITRWFRAISGPARGMADVTSADMISEIRLHEHAGLFTGNPLLLTALCLFYLVGGKRIPDQRADLYDRIVGNLLYRRFHDPVDTEKENKVREYLMELAFFMQSHHIKSIEACDAKDILKTHYPGPVGEDETVPVCKKRIEELFNGIEPVCGLLNRLSSGEIEFAHLSFQEFLAAKHMMDRDMDYKPYLENGWWKEVILLYLGLMNLEMKKRSNDIVCELVEKHPNSRIQLLGARALRDFQASKREEYAIIPTREKLMSISGSKSPLEERFEAGEILGKLGDPRIDVLNPPMVPVKAGEFTRGSDEYDDEKPVRQIYLDEYMMGKYPVTNAEFKGFILDGGYENKEYWTLEGWQWRQEENISEPLYWHDRKWNGPNFPVVGVSWYEAYAYAQWLSGKTGNDYRLPTEAQWEKAARGSRGFQYPWGNDFDKDKCNSDECGLGRTSPVGIFPDGKSPYGCLDMAGNVWEWCADWYEENYYKGSPARNPQGPAGGSNRVLRGGSWFSIGWICRAALRNGRHPADRGGGAGFRLLRSL